MKLEFEPSLFVCLFFNIARQYHNPTSGMIKSSRASNSYTGDVHSFLSLTSFVTLKRFNLVIFLICYVNKELVSKFLSSKLDSLNSLTNNLERFTFTTSKNANLTFI